MTFEGAFIIFIFGFFIVIPALYVILLLIKWLTGSKAKVGWLLVCAIILAPLILSLLLDLSGTTQQVKVVEKHERVTIDADGDWHRPMSVTVEYETPGESLPARLGLGCDPQTFDALVEGQQVDVRLLDFGGVFKFARLKSHSTFSMFASLLPSNPDGPWHEATAKVQRVVHVTYHSARRSNYDLRWPYDVVEFTFTPEGRQQTITAVDVIEAGSVANIYENSEVKIIWPEDDPRSAKIAGAIPGSFWKNWLYSFSEAIAFIIVLLAIFAVFGYWKRMRKKKQLKATLPP
ncbi:MAG TPA: hypothetical protein VEF04_05960 [Blastocatellia bacterium]|nr:hypothetical protein [Blastocatellia bacterium]